KRELQRKRQRHDCSLERELSFVGRQWLHSCRYAQVVCRNQDTGTRPPGQIRTDSSKADAATAPPAGKLAVEQTDEHFARRRAALRFGQLGKEGADDPGPGVEYGDIEPALAGIDRRSEQTRRRRPSCADCMLAYVADELVDGEANIGNHVAALVL